MSNRKNRFGKTAGPACLLLLACLVGADSDVYKWVDAEGNVHYGDKPPEGVASEQLHLEPGASADAVRSDSKFIEQTMERSKRRAEARKSRVAQEQAEKQERLARERRCVYARQQLISLQQQLPVYRDEDGKYRTVSRYDAYEGKREYLDDATRNREIDRVQQDINTDCEHPDDRKQQFTAGWERKMSKRCEAAQAELKALQRPDARSPPQTIEEARELVETYCETDD